MRLLFACIVLSSVGGCRNVLGLEAPALAVDARANDATLTGGGGGGGSSLVSASVAAGTTMAGSGATPGNAGDSQRGTAGAGATTTGANGGDGRIVLQ